MNITDNPIDAGAKQAAEVHEITAERQTEAQADDYVDRIVRGEATDADPIVPDGEPEPSQEGGEVAAEQRPPEDDGQPQNEPDEQQAAPEDDGAEPDEDDDSRPAITDQHERKAERLKMKSLLDQAKRYRDAADRRLEAAEQRLAAAEERAKAAEQQMAFVTEYTNALRTGKARDAIGIIAKQAGMSLEDVMQEAIEDAAGGGTKSMERRLDELATQLEREREARKKESEERQRVLQRAEVDRLVAQDVRQFVGIKDNPELARLYPAIAALPASIIEEQVTPILRDRDRMVNEYGGSLDNMAAELDKKFKFVVHSNSGGTGIPRSSGLSGSTESKNPTGSRATEANAATRPGGSQHRQAAQNLTNRDAADGRTNREMTTEEYEAEAARLESELVSAFYAED